MQDSVTNLSVAISLQELNRLFCIYCISFGGYVLFMVRNAGFFTYGIKFPFVNKKAHFLRQMHESNLNKGSQYCTLSIIPTCKMLWKTNLEKVYGNTFMAKPDLNSCETVFVLYLSSFV